MEQHQTAKEREFQRSHSEANPQKGEDNYQLGYGTNLEILSNTARRSQDHYDAIVTGEREHRAELERVSLQALQNAVETANMVSKQVIRAQENSIETANLRGKDAVRHSQIATDQQWNTEPQEAFAEGMLSREILSQPVMAAIQAAVAKAVTDSLSSKSE